MLIRFHVVPAHSLATYGSAVRRDVINHCPMIVITNVLSARRMKYGNCMNVILTYEGAHIAGRCPTPGELQCGGLQQCHVRLEVRRRQWFERYVEMDSHESFAGHMDRFLLYHVLHTTF